MIVTYIGKTFGMVSYGYDFSYGPVDVPETDKFAIKKYLGNRYFHCDHVDNFGPAPSVKPAPAQVTPTPPAPEISIGVFKQKEDGNPYSRPEKVFTGSDEAYLMDQANCWMTEKEIDHEDRIVVVK